MSKWHKWYAKGDSPSNLTRRAFLGAAGAVITLPWMESLSWANTAPGAPPLRQLFWYVPNGMRMERFVPVDTGVNYTMTEILSNIAAHRDKFLVLSNVSQSPGAYPVAGDHARGTAAFLTSRTANAPGEATNLGPSVDYLLSQSSYASQTPLRSVHLALNNHGTSGTCDSGYACAFQNSITWSSPTTPVPPRLDPRSAFNALFGTFNPDAANAEALRRYERRQSILDHVTAEAATLRGRISVNDRRKLDQYLTGVRELEMRLDNNPPDQVAAVCTTGTQPAGYTSYAEHMDQMIDIMVKAIECDATRVLSFMADSSGSYRSFSFMGVPEAHHEMSHWNFSSAEAPHRLAQWQAICEWHTARFGDLLTRLDAITEHDGSTLLDNSLIYYSSEIGDGHSHDHHDMPVVLAGGACGQVNTGRHHRYGAREPLANLFLGMMNLFGAPQSSFGQDSTGIITDVFV